MNRTNKSSRIRVSIQILDEHGELIEETDPEESFEVTLGEGELPPTVEDALIDRPEGDTIEVTCPEGEAFGDPDPEAIVAVSREDFPADMELEKGGLVNIRVEPEEGEDEEEAAEMAAVIIEVNPDGVILDANHPLAGRPATFKVTVDAILS